MYKTCCSWANKAPYMLVYKRASKIINLTKEMWPKFRSLYRSYKHGLKYDDSTYYSSDKSYKNHADKTVVKIEEED